MGASEAVLRGLADGVLTLTINRADRRNALSAEVLDGLQAGLEAAREDPAVRVVVLTGAGDRAFCAGGDLASGMAGAKGGFPGQLAEKGRYADLLLAFAHLGKPAVARVAGDALGGGLGLVLACDLAIAADDVRLGLPEIHVGLWPMMVTALLVRHVGLKTASELMLLGEKLSAVEAHDLRLINRVVLREDLDAEVARVAGGIAARSPAVVRLGRDALYQTMDLPLEPALFALRDRLVINGLLEDTAEGVMAFLQKRPPVWKGR
ncbi:MAG: enoyl-CoA hydratase-related protein [bacterium]